MESYYPNRAMMPPMNSLKYKGIKRLFVALVSAFAMLASQTACTASSLPPYEAEYTTKMRGIRINSDRKFIEIAENTYRLSWKAKALWMRISEWSDFEIIDDKVRPISYHYTRKGLGSDRPINIEFDWENMQANGSKGDKQYNFALDPNSLDRLSFQVQMQLDLINDKTLTEFNYRIANYNGMRDYRFEFEKSESVDTRIGTFETLVFKRDKKDSSIRLWMSPKQFYLPVKVEQTGDDANTVLIRGWKSEKEHDETIAYINKRNLSEGNDNNLPANEEF